MGPLTFPRIPDQVRERHATTGWALALAGGVLLVVSGLLSWCFDDRVLGNVAVRFWPATY